MLSGMMNAENVSQILRGVSQKRQNGIMELNFADRSVQLFFVSGKIVDVVDSEIAPVHEVLRWFKGAGYIEPEHDLGEIPSIHDLFLELNERHPDSGLIDEALFRRVVRERVLNALHLLNFENPAVFGFKMQMVEYDRHFSPSISVSQVLLDRVAYETDTERFRAQFPAHASVRRSDHSAEALSEEEQIIYDLLSEELPLDLVRARALLSAHKFQSSLLALHDRGAIDVEVRSNPTREEIAGALSDELFEALDGSTERPYIPQGQLSVHSETVTDEAGANGNGTQSYAANAGSKMVELTADLEENDPEEEEFEEEIEEESAYSSEISAREPSISYFTYYNIKLLQYQAIPNLLIALFLMALILVPFYRWGKILTEF